MKTNLYKHLLLFVLCSILFAIIPASALAAEEYTVTDMSATGSLSASTLNVRIGPAKDYESIGKISSTDNIIITGQASTGWYRIDYNGEDGYISNSYVTISEAAASGENNNIDEANTFEDYIEESETKTLSPATYIIIGVIVVVILAIIVSMIKMFRNSDDEDEEEDEDVYDEEDEDVYEEEDYEEDDTEDIPPAPRKNRAVRTEQPKSPVTKKKTSGIPAKTSPSKTPVSDIPMQESTTVIKGDDYRIYIDPRYFDEEEQPVPEPEADKTDLEIEEAMNKLNELQQEIERLKRQKNSR